MLNIIKRIKGLRNLRRNEVNEEIPEYIGKAMDLTSIDWEYEGKCSKKYILVDIELLKNKLSVWSCMTLWKKIEKLEWRYLLSAILVEELKKAWKAGKKECDITALFEITLIAKKDNVEWVLEKAEVTKRILKEFEVLKEDDERVYLTML